MPDPRSSKLPLWVKLAYTAFCAVLVPFYWSTYGPTNFLYFCDVALLMGLVALWLESPLLASMPAVGILIPQALWCVDFLGELIGVPVVSLTGYMFKPEIPLFARGLSFFHFWLPFFLTWLVWKLGYDARALPAWTVLAWVLVLVCFAFLPEPPAPEDNPNMPVNVNYVWGFSDKAPQEWMPQWQYLTLLMLGLPALIFIPTHLLLTWAFGRRNEAKRETPAEGQLRLS